MEKRTKIIAAYGSALAIVAVITLFALITNHQKIESIIGDANAPAIPSIAEDAKELQGATPQGMPEGDEESVKTELDGVSFGGGGGAGAGKTSTAVDQPNLPICPSALDVEYFIDYKKTTSTKDDDVYLGIRNNKPQIERISISIDGNEEGVMEVRSLGVSVMKSPTITAWWDSLNEATSKTFIVQLVPENCMMIISQVTVNYPPSETDYLD
ncbi:MAG: hypothetical protein V1906_02480 [Candidatus Woesearchaeota archaeon]